MVEWLLREPHLYPLSGRHFDERLTYVDNDFVRQVLIDFCGEDAYQRCDDSDFLQRFRSLNTRFYEKIASYLFGMNRKKVNLVAAQDIASNVGDQDDAICIAGFQALLLHPYIFSMLVATKE